MSIAMVDRALGGRRARKLRAVLPERPLNGEKVARTEVMYLVSILRRRSRQRVVEETKMLELKLEMLDFDWLLPILASAMMDS
jgi:hypothetical protein